MADDADAPAAADATAGEATEATPPLILAVWLSDSARVRLAESGDFEITDDSERVDAADLIAVSTRVPRGQSAGVVAEFRAATAKPIVAIAHAGGEDVAVEMLTLGASGLVAEGNEEAIHGYLAGTGHNERLVDTFERSVARRDGDGAGDDDGRDPVTRLPGAAALEERLVGAAHADQLPRLGFVSLPGFDRACRRLSLDAAELLRRRIAAALAELCHHAGADVYTLGDADYAVVATSLSLSEFDRLGHHMAVAAGSFNTAGAAPLALAMGHAGPEATSEPATLRQLARRALDQALRHGAGSSVVSADKLSRMLASSTEFEAARRALDFIEERGHPHHGTRVASYADALARRLGLEGREATRIRLAGYLHHIGKVSLPAEALAPEADLAGEALAAYRTHCERGAALLRTSAGEEVAAMVRAHHEHWDGTGYPDELEGEAIPLGARIVAVADALDPVSDRVDGAAPTPQAVAAVQEASGTRYDPAVVSAAVEAFG